MAEGVVSLFQAPALYGNESGQGWVTSQLKLLSLNATGLLKECLSTFTARYSNTPRSQLSSAMEAAISGDLLRMQTQPSIMENYRRYVVITATGADQVESNRDGVCFCFYYSLCEYSLVLGIVSSNGPKSLNSTSKTISSPKLTLLT